MIHNGSYNDFRLRNITHVIFPFLYYWFKDHYYQRSFENFNKTHWDYIDTRELISENPELQAQIHANPPDVLALSLYVWNLEKLLKNAKWIKDHYPRCLIIAGGPSAEAKTKWLQEHSFIDFVVRGPGTEIFRLILDDIFENKNAKEVPGVSYLQNNEVKNNPSLPRHKDPLIFNHAVNFHDEIAEWLHNETSKGNDILFSTLFYQGCPYSCSFCEQGLELWTKITRRPIEHVFAEIDLLSNYKNVHYHFIDSNFGITPDYEKIVDYIIDIKNYKNKEFYMFRPTFAKNNVEDTFRMHKKMIDNNFAGNFAVNGYLALQDTDREVLKINGRPYSKEFEKIEQFNKLIDSSNSRHVVAHVDIILGMPGQSKKSITQTLVDLYQNNLLSASIPQLYVVTPNTRLTEDPNAPYYRSNEMTFRSMDGASSAWLDKYDISKTLEFTEHILVESETLTPKELASMFYIFAFINFSFGFIRWFDSIEMYLKNYYNISGEEFVRKLCEKFYVKNTNNLPAEIQKDIRSLHAWFNGETKHLEREDQHKKGYLCLGTMSRYRFMANYEEFEKITIDIFEDLTGKTDQLFLDIMAWNKQKTLMFSNTEWPKKVVSYNYDDIAQAKSDTYYLSEFTFNWYISNISEIIDRIEDNENILFIPDIEVNEVDEKIQKPLRLTKAAIS